eukprot:maker-scaffold_30-snap-gene-1.5-mRNA-1 protein AED:0.40 eAED:0.45 QI:0/0/0/1/0/0/2/0/128
MQDMELNQKTWATFFEKITYPSVTLIHLRARWSFRGIKNIHTRYEALRDQYLGRMVSGLALDSHLFTVLPPHFGESKDYVADTLRILLTYLDEYFGTGWISMPHFNDLLSKNFLERNLDTKHALRRSY